MFLLVTTQANYADASTSKQITNGDKKLIISQGFRGRRNQYQAPPQMSPEEAKKLYEQEWGYVDKPQSAPPRATSPSTISPDKPLFAPRSQWPQYVPNKINESTDPITQRRNQKMEKMARETPPGPMPNLTPPPGGDEATVFAPPMLEKIANDKIIKALYGGRFFFTPDGGNSSTPWWVVDGYKSQPSPYD
jgi:hypothetical protein